MPSMAPPYTNFLGGPVFWGQVTFTRDAIKEATRDGASPIDLIDGEDLVDMLKQLRLGVEVRMVEEVDVNTAWFENI